ncbi:MAG: EAL domain-containing protein [Magnetococcales bacterium]|nr:EAL domain-containing protein [Magnetococcales bacterium]
MSGGKKSKPIKRVENGEGVGKGAGLPGDSLFEARLLHVLLQNSAEGVVVADRRGAVRQVNQAFSQMTGFSPEEVRGRHVRRYLSASAIAQHGEWMEALTLGQSWEGSSEVRSKGGELLAVRARVNAIHPEGEPVHFYVCQFFPQNALSPPPGPRLAGLLSNTTDAVTGLPTRMLFEDRVQQAITQARRNASSVALLLVDLQRFKAINETLGRKAGDFVLSTVAERLTALLRTSDSVARLEADQFALLLTHIDKEPSAVRNTDVVARKVLEGISHEPVILSEGMGSGAGQEVPISVCLGITLFPQDGESCDELLRNAAIALGHARRRGWNAYEFFSAQMAETARRRFLVENDLRRALDKGELCLFYQPQVDLGSGEIVGAEALIRWRHPSRGLVPPGEFIPVAEESGLIVPIGEWVMQEACRQQVAWRRQGLDLVRVGVNISALQFRRQNLADMVSRLMGQSGIDPCSLDLEITESSLMEDVDKVVGILRKISEQGVHLSMDDFGTGYSSLSYLRRFPFKTLKIDRSFISQIERDSSDAAIVGAIVAMAHNLNLNVIAEGLENREQLAILQQLKCDELQGFLFSRPVPADDMEQLLKKKVGLNDVLQALDARQAKS